MICIIGIAGSGKSTQRDLLCQMLNCSYVYPGELLRENLTGEQKRKLEAGEHIDDQITIQLLEADFNKKHVDSSECVLDGAPRTIDQAKWFSDKVKSGQIKLSGIIHLAMDKATAKQRLLSRIRHDDVAEAIEERFKVFETLTKPVLDYLRDQGFKVHDINAGDSPEEINARIQAALGIT